MESPESYDSEVPGSSPQGTLIPLATDAQHAQPQDTDNIYSFDLVETPLFKEPPGQSALQTQSPRKKQSQVIILDSEDAVGHSVEEVVEDSSAIYEVSRKEFMNSQKQRVSSTQEAAPVSPADGNGSLSPQHEYFELRSGQSPIASSQRLQITSSSPVQTQETQLLPQRMTNSVVPSAQLTSFRMQSPKKITSAKTTPKKRNILIQQDSFTIPHLLSPSKSNLGPTQLTPIRGDHTPGSNISSSPSIYCTARQNVQDTMSPKYEIKTSAVKVKGRFALGRSSPFTDFQTRVLPMKRPNEIEEILDSSEDESESEISIIEITRTVKKARTEPTNDVILQVPSSQGLASSLGSSPLKPAPLLKDLENVNDYQDEDFEDDANDELNQMSMDQLRTKIMHYGLKPSRSKQVAIEALRSVNKFLSQNSIELLSQSQNINHSQIIIKKDVFAAIDEVMIKNEKLMEKIYTFEPAASTEFLTWLDENGVSVSTEFFMAWCDNNSICLTDIDELRSKKSD